VARFIYAAFGESAAVNLRRDRFGSEFFGRAGAEIREFYDASMAEVKAAGQKPPESLKMLEFR
jgi:hypothetical protein